MKETRKPGWSGDSTPCIWVRMTRRGVQAVLAVAVLWGSLIALHPQDPVSVPKSDTSAPGLLSKVGGLSPAVLGQDYLISPDDVLDVHVFEVPELSRDYRVSPIGMIALPLLSGPIPAAGLTPSQLSQVIKERFRASGVLSNPQVMVAVKESRLSSVTVSGAVRTPQMYRTFGRTTLLDVITQAGGLTDDAANVAIISRGEVGARALELDREKAGAAQEPPLSRVVTIDVRRLLETGDPKLNVDIYPGDRVTIRRAGVFYVVGAVNSPGGFTLRDEREEITVLKAIALAHDVKPTALRSKAMIIRRNPEKSGGREEIRLDLKKILAGRAPDTRLVAQDILFVPDSTAKKALRRAADTAIGVTSGLIIFRR